MEEEQTRIWGNQTVIGIPFEGKTIQVPVLRQETQIKYSAGNKAELLVPGRVIQSAGVDYTLESRLGNGGMGDVWKARALFKASPRPDDDVERIVALKFIRELSDVLEGLLINEAKMTAQINHDNIVHFEAWGYIPPKEPAKGAIQTEPTDVRQSKYMIAMEYIDGIDVTGLMLSHNLVSRERPVYQQVLRQNLRRIPDEIVGFIMFSVANALDYAHNFQIKGSRGIIHRDLSPGNILIKTDEGSVKLSDFGIAVTTQDLKQTDSGFFVGKFPYVSPEQIYKSMKRDEKNPDKEEAVDIDARSDLYSLGIVGYEMLTGFSPNHYFGLNEKDIGKVLPRQLSMAARELIPAHEIVQGISQELSEIIYKLISLETKERYQSAAELYQAIGRCIYKEGFGVTKSYLRDYIALNNSLDSRELPNIPEAKPDTAEWKGMKLPIPYKLTTYARRRLEKGENPARL
jgi:serine/threonine protein kinase